MVLLSQRLSHLQGEERRGQVCVCEGRLRRRERISAFGAVHAGRRGEVEPLLRQRQRWGVGTSGVW